MSNTGEVWLASLFGGVYLRPDGSVTDDPREARHFETQADAIAFVRECLIPAPNSLAPPSAG